jgi:predicted porin
VSDKVSVAGYVVNGWNNTSETNDDKTFAANLTLKPSSRFAWYLNYMGGKEVEGGDMRNLFDTTLSLSLSDKFSLMGNFDYGEEGSARWWGWAAYAKLQPTSSWALAGRYEYVDDTEGGWMTLGTKAQTITVTSDHLIAGGLRARLEYRTDLADEAIFTDEGDASKDSQTTFTVGLVYVFGGKI